MNRSSFVRFASAGALAAGLFAFASESHAQTRFVERLALRVEGGVGAMLSEQQISQGYGFTLQGGLRLGLTIWDPVTLQVGVSNWYFPSAMGAGGAVMLGGGMRFEPMISRLGRLFVDGEVGAGWTGNQTRTMIDIGFGFEFAPLPWLGIGPVLRYGRMITQAQDIPADPQFFSFGLSVALRAPRRPEPVVVVVVAPPDTDHDGVPDPADACPADVSGDHPDPDRAGCPDGDEDHDGVLDHADQCRTIAAGAHADPARAGCPAPDRDNDGVPDATDACADQAPGEHPDPDRAGCPDGDADADGVLDHADQCRAEAAGAHPDPARAGCPLPDGDHDGVPDATDHCPTQAGAPSTDANRNGCPGLVRIEGSSMRITHQVFFATNADRILPQSFRVLQAVADALRAAPEIHRVSVEGHTDDVGDAARNTALSQRRAEAVVLWLSQHGVEAARLEAHGYGPSRPLVQGTTAAARASNRRVEFHIGGPSTVAPALGASSSPSSAAP